MFRGRISLHSIFDWSIKNRLIIALLKQANELYETIKKIVNKDFILVLIIIKKNFFYKLRNLVLINLKKCSEYFKKCSTTINVLFNILKAMLLTIYLFYRIISILIKEFAE